MRNLVDGVFTPPGRCGPGVPDDDAGGQVTVETAEYHVVNRNRLDMEMHGYARSASGMLKPDDSL